MSLLREYIQKTLSQIRPPDDSKFSINGIPLDLEVVDTPDKIQMGLMFREKLAANGGMIFIFQDVQPRSFWMRNTKIPLSIAYADREGVIINIEDMEPFSDRRILSKAPAFCALEMNQGWFDDNKIKPGDVIVGVK
tara:strand:- start:19 stop:426 length:408 start_codon:yes stop_codon:yes gene_type:complete